MSITKELQTKWTTELIFLLMTAIVTFLIVFPVHNYYNARFPFITMNYAIVFIFLTHTRLLFLLGLTPYSHNHYVKLFLLFSCIPMLLYVIDSFYEFQSFIDIGELEKIARPGDSLIHTDKMTRYTTFEMIFFIAGTFITCILIPLRMVVSIWRVVNKKNKV